MAELSSEHLQELTALVNERLAEFGPAELRLDIGIVRIAHDVIVKWYQEKGESWAMQRISDVTITAEMAGQLSRQGYSKGYDAAKREQKQESQP